MKKLIPVLMLCSCIRAFAQLPTYVPTNGLMGWWSLNGNANDASINGNNGTNNGATDTTDRYGNPNSAYFFNGSSSYISIPTSASLESPSVNLTMSAWVKLSGYSLVGQSFDPILSKSNSSANAFMYRFDVDINGTGFYAGTNNWTTNTGVLLTLSLNQWYLVTAVLDSFNSYLYLNDSLVGTNSFTTNIAIDNLPLEIGRDVMGNTEVFNGILDDIGIWNVALTHQQVTALYLASAIGVSEEGIKNQSFIYPNPVSNDAAISITNASGGSTELFLYDAKGNMVKKYSAEILPGNFEWKFSTADLPQGFYAVRVSDEKKQWLMKLVKD